jgi:glycosyltransferase involved in cell wall biosynthesis
MRIGIDARFYGPIGKGLGRYTEKLIEHLETLPGDDEYVIFLRRENFSEYVPKHPRFRKVLADYAWYGWEEQLFFPWLLRRERLDLVHFPHFNVPLLARRPFVVTVHDLILLRYPTVKASELSPFLYWFKYLAYRFVIGSAVRRARRIITVSAFTREDIETVYPKTRGKIIVTAEASDDFCFWLPPNETARLFDRLGLWEKAGSIHLPYFLSVGNAYPHKNLEFLVEMAKQLPEYHFLLVGKDDYFYRSLKKRVEMEAVGNVLFAGYVDDRALGALYRHAVAYVFSSLYEGFGLPGLEAMNHGLPVVASRAGSLPEVFGDAALYVDPHNVASGVRLLRQVTEARTRRLLVARGHARSRGYSWRRMAELTQQIYQESGES